MQFSVFSFLPAEDVHVEHFAAGQECERLCFCWPVTEDEDGWTGFVNTWSGSSIVSRFIRQTWVGWVRLARELGSASADKENGGVLLSKRSRVLCRPEDPCLIVMSLLLPHRTKAFPFFRSDYST